ncbi:MAG: FAD-dependent oxidoreductase [Candidatus Bipolaricaulota bacterium]|nr:FAD-dependent oxidoreductase [Candidatus Bipolaricaulota bacterium]
MDRYDVAVVGLGPAGMAVAAMAAHVGLKVVGIEKRALGGECMNTGCIPSKALLRTAHVRHLLARAADYALAGEANLVPKEPFRKIAEHLTYIREKKTRAMLDKVELVVGRGAAAFVDPHTLEVDGQRFRAKRIFLCTGSLPAVPPIPGIESVPYLTNENLFQLERIPARLVVLGGGAIGCEMAQAFRRLGSEVAIVHMDAHLLPHGDPDAGDLLEAQFQAEGIRVLNGRRIRSAERTKDGVALTTEAGERLEGDVLLVAAGRRWDFSALHLERAGVAHGPKGIPVNRYLQTSRRHIFAPGDANGLFLFSHAAMHQGMLAFINSLVPGPLKLNFRKYVVPWTVFTDPPVAHVGLLERELKARGIRYETIETRYEDYGAAIAEGVAVGSVKAYVGTTGRVYGVRIVGEGAGEMIGEWALVVQKRIRIHHVAFLQHAFPTMNFLTKRVAEGWLMNRTRGPGVRRLVRLLCR